LIITSYNNNHIILLSGLSDQIMPERQQRRTGMQRSAFTARIGEKWWKWLSSLFHLHIRLPSAFNEWWDAKCH